MYWRVAVIDPDNNTGAFSKAKKFTILARMQVQLAGVPGKGGAGSPIITVPEREGQADQGRRGEAQGRRHQTRSRAEKKKVVVSFNAQAQAHAGDVVATVTRALQGRLPRSCRSSRPRGCRAGTPGTPPAAHATMAAVSGPPSSRDDRRDAATRSAADLVATALTLCARR